MRSATEDLEATWYTSARFRRIALTVLVMAIAIEGYYAIFRRQGDLVCHVDFGRHFLEGRPYASPGNYYPLGRVMLDAPLAIVNYRLVRAVLYLLAIASLVYCFRIWERIATLSGDGANRLSGPHAFAAVVLTLTVLGPFIIRDLDECGLQIFLLLMCSLAAAAFQRQRHAVSGFWLAAAATYKATPLLFLPFLLWKREWKAAGFMLIFFVGFGLLPATHLGWAQTLAAHKHWFLHTQSIARDTPEAHPSVPNIELPKHQNVSLPAGFARFVESYPPGHPLYLDHPLFVQFGGLAPADAKRAVMILTLLVGAAVAWMLRRRYSNSGSGGDQAIGREWAATCIFCAILSPLCWRQHLVLLIPAALLLARSLLAGEQMSRIRVSLLGGVAVACFLMHRTILGKELTVVVLSYHVVTFASVAMAFLLLTGPAVRQAAATSDALPRPSRQAA